MGIRILAEVFGDILFRFTRSVTEHYNPEEADFTVEAFGYDPLESTGREWYYQPVTKNTVTEKLPHGIIYRLTVLISRLSMRAHQVKKQMDIKKMTGQWLGNA